jgi:predicted DNA-binding transcriptional regulator AlpA
MEEEYIGLVKIAELTGLTKKTIYNQEKNDINFPKRLQVGDRFFPIYNKKEIENWFLNYYSIKRSKKFDFIEQLISNTVFE